MKKALLTLGAAGVLSLGIVFPAYAADTNVNLSSLSIAELQALVEKLTAQIKALTSQVNSQAQLIAKLRLNSVHNRGERGEEVKLLQQILATDPTLYPEGLTTGFFGDLTSKAISRFQARYGLTVTGTLTPETKELLNKILDAEGDDAVRAIPPGLLLAPGLEGRVIVTQTNNGGQIVFKIEVKDKDGDDEDDENDDEDDNEDENDDQDESDDNDDENIEIEVRVDDDDAKVKVEEGSQETIFTLDETDEDEIIDKLVTRLGMDREDVEDIIEFDHVDNNSNSWDSDDDEVDD